MTRVVDSHPGWAHTGTVEQQPDPVREQRERQERVARLERAVASVERTRRLVDERLRGSQVTRSR